MLVEGFKRKPISLSQSGSAHNLLKIAVGALPAPFYLPLYFFEIGFHPVALELGVVAHVPVRGSRELMDFYDFEASQGYKEAVTKQNTPNYEALTGLELTT